MGDTRTPIHMQMLVNIVNISLGYLFIFVFKWDYRYIMNRRPCTASNYVFISHRVPYDRLNRTCCCRALNKVLGKRKHGFHITRKTFASRMLKSKTNTDTIVDFLGHSDKSIILKYLATDGYTMRQCALSLKGIEVEGGMLA